MSEKYLFFLVVSSSASLLEPSVSSKPMCKF